MCRCLVEAEQASARVTRRAPPGAGEAHLAALHLLAAADVLGALGVYRRAGLLHEAALLAAARLPPDHPELRDLRNALQGALGRASAAPDAPPAHGAAAEPGGADAQAGQPPAAQAAPAQAVAPRRQYTRPELVAFWAAMPAREPPRGLDPALQIASMTAAERRALLDSINNESRGDAPAGMPAAELPSGLASISGESRGDAPACEHGDTGKAAALRRAYARGKLLALRAAAPAPAAALLRCLPAGLAVAGACNNNEQHTAL